jgi:hypothetical protein
MRRTVQCICLVLTTNLVGMRLSLRERARQNKEFISDLDYMLPNLDTPSDRIVVLYLAGESRRGRRDQGNTSTSSTV